MDTAMSRTAGSREEEEEHCTVCKNKPGAPRRTHPVLGVVVCRGCYNRVLTYSAKEGGDTTCLWCRKAVPEYELVNCTTCTDSVCRRCISKNFGAALFKRLKKMFKTWKCFACCRESFLSLCQECGIVTRQKGTVRSTGSGVKKSLICADISNGLESIPIPVYNEVDKCPPPANFQYITENVLGTGVNLCHGNPNFLSCCSCKDNCSDPTVCECALSMAGFAYDQKGSFFADKPGGVYECNYLCSCHKDLCRNRLVSNGPNMPLEVYRCPEVGKGWGVRCAVELPIGTFIADYLGEVLNEVDAEARVEADEYLFGMDAFARSHACQVLTDVGMKKTEPPPPELVSKVDSISKERMEKLLGGELATKIFERPKICNLIDYEADSNIPRDKNKKSNVSMTYLDTIRNSGSRKRDIDKLLGSTGDLQACIADDSVSDAYTTRKKQIRDARAALMERAMTEAETKNNTYTLDANHFGNVARFLNHSCTPNVEKVTVFCDSQDVRLPRVALFTSQVVPAGEELCYDYGYFQGNVEGKHRKCLCGSEKCRGNMY